MTISRTDKMEFVKSAQKSIPVQTVNLARDIGIDVYHASGWPDNLSGKIERSEEYGGRSGFAIFVNKDHHPNRRRFTTAHEIAHFILHEDLIGDGIVDDALYRSNLSNALEAEANKLAADILMPWDHINKLIAEGKTDVKLLAKEFDVSTSAMAIRLGVPA